MFERLKRRHRCRKVMLSDADRLAGTYVAAREAIRSRLENAIRLEQLICDCMALGVSTAMCEEALRNESDPETALVRLRDAAAKGPTSGLVMPSDVEWVTAELRKVMRQDSGIMRLFDWIECLIKRLSAQLKH